MQERGLTERDGGATDIAAARQSPHSLSHRAGRAFWGFVQGSLFRWSPRPMHGWRRWLLRLFGATIDGSARVYPAARIWAPWNLRLDAEATIADEARIYNVASVRIGARTTVSQLAHLCAATHDFESPAFPLRPAPIEVGSDCWIAADVFVGPGVRIGDGTVVGARSSVFGDLPGGVVATGSPARPTRPRRLTSPPQTLE